MVIIDYQKKYHRQIIKSCMLALKQGKVLAYPTDTSYGLAVDASNIAAVKKLYRVKGRNFNKPVHVVVPSVAYAKKIVKWDKLSARLVKKFWPGALTLVLGLRGGGVGYRILSAKSGWLGIRMPKNPIALDLAKYLKQPITATSANVSGMGDCYSADDVIKQFKEQKYKPDIIISTKKLPKRKPSTVVKVGNHQITILRAGPVTGKQMSKVLGVSF